MHETGFISLFILEGSRLQALSTFGFPLEAQVRWLAADRNFRCESGTLPVDQGVQFSETRCPFVEACR